MINNPIYPFQFWNNALERITNLSFCLMTFLFLSLCVKSCSTDNLAEDQARNDLMSSCIEHCGKGYVVRLTSQECSCSATFTVTNEGLQ